MIRKDNLEAMIKAIGYIYSSRSKVFEKKYAYNCNLLINKKGKKGCINGTKT